MYVSVMPEVNHQLAFHLFRHHYENLPMQFTETFSAAKMENFVRKILIFFLFFAQNIYRGFTLEPPRRCGSNEYPQSMFWSKTKKNRCPPAYPCFLYKSGVYGGFV